MHYYLSDWVWNTSGYFPHWGKPSGVVDALDLRNLTQCAQQGGLVDASARGFFSTPVLDSNLDIYLGSELDAPISTQVKRGVESRLNLQAGTITASTVRGLLAQVLTEQGDPTGVDRFRPLMSGDIHCGGLIWSGNFKSNPLWLAKWVSVKRDEYRNIRRECLDGHLNPTTYLKVLDFWQHQYKMPFERFIPDDLPIETPLPRATRIEDTFVEASDTALSAHTATGTDGGHSWSYMSGTFTVIAATNDCDSATASAHNNARADADLSSSDHFTEGDLTMASGGSRDAGLLVRCASAADTAYIVLVDGITTDTILYKVVAGSYTLINDYNDAPGAPSSTTYKLDVSGSTLTPSISGTPLTGQTDTTITGNVRCGIRAFDIQTTIDNFVADDGVGGSDLDINSTGLLTAEGISASDQDTSISAAGVVSWSGDSIQTNDADISATALVTMEGQSDVTTDALIEALSAFAPHVPDANFTAEGAALASVDLSAAATALLSMVGTSTGEGAAILDVNAAAVLSLIGEGGVADVIEEGVTVEVGGGGGWPSREHYRKKRRNRREQEDEFMKLIALAMPSIIAHIQRAGVNQKTLH